MRVICSDLRIHESAPILDPQRIQDPLDPPGSTWIRSQKIFAIWIRIGFANPANPGFAGSAILRIQRIQDPSDPGST